MAKNKDYWIKRMEMVEAREINKGESYFRDLERQYRSTAREIEKELTVWYQRFADNNDVNMTEARRLLGTRELDEFRWTVDEYIKFGKENAIDRRWMKQLENASARVHVSRFESIQFQLQQQVEVLYGNRVDEFDSLLGDIYRDGYYRNAYEIQKGLSVGWDLAKIDDNQLKKILSRPWTTDGRTFSDRIWNNKNKLITDLQMHLTQAVSLGTPPDQAIKEMVKYIGVDDLKPRQALYRAGRLVMTESAAFSSMAQEDCFKDLGVERFEYLATLDNDTSEICRGMDGNIEEMKNYQVGVTAPPLHAFCRSTTIPYFEDNAGERAARGADGKTYYVPADMKYKEWKNSFVAGDPKTGLKERG